MADSESVLDSRSLLAMHQTGCLRHTAVVACGKTTRDVARWFDPDGGLELSRLALVVGEQFEAGLFKDRDGAVAARLVELYRKRGWFESGATVEDLSDLDPAQAWDRTKEILWARSRGQAAPDLILQGALRLPIGRTQYLRPDVLAAEPDTGAYRPAEIKSYEYRYYLTDDTDINKAVMQSALYLACLMDHADLPKIAREPVVDVIFRETGSFFGHLESMRVDRDLEMVRLLLAAFPATPEALAKLLGKYGISVPADLEKGGKDLLAQIPNRYSERCRSVCSLEPQCRAALEQSDALRRYGDGAMEAFDGFETVGQALRALGAAPAQTDPPHLYELRLASVEADKLTQSNITVSEATD